MMVPTRRLHQRRWPRRSARRVFPSENNGVRLIAVRSKKVKNCANCFHADFNYFHAYFENEKFCVSNSTILYGCMQDKISNYSIRSFNCLNKKNLVWMCILGKRQFFVKLIHLFCLGRLKMFFRKTLLFMNSDDIYHNAGIFPAIMQRSSHLQRKHKRKNKTFPKTKWKEFSFEFAFVLPSFMLGVLCLYICRTLHCIPLFRLLSFLAYTGCVKKLMPFDSYSNLP